MAAPEQWLEFHRAGSGMDTIRPPTDETYFIVKGIFIHRTSGVNNCEMVLTDGTNPMTMVNASSFRLSANIRLSRDWYMVVDNEANVNYSITCEVVGAAQG